MPAALPLPVPVALTVIVPLFVIVPVNTPPVELLLTSAVFPF